MSQTRDVPFEIPWTSSEGRTYSIPVLVHLVFQNDEHAAPGWVFDDFELDGLTEDELPTLITDKDDLDEFCLDNLSEDAYEMALDRL